MSKPTDAAEVDDLNDAQKMHKVRELVFGSDKQQIKQVLNDNAREVVGNVVIEALHDRQKKQDGLSHVLGPIVEKSVEKSVKDHSDQFVGYLYPLVGRLVRKSVTSFLSEFLEKTNQLIENSLSFKGLAWRYKAWQSGVSFSQYVASKTFVYRVEQVFLIHLDTGILLKSVSLSNHATADADMVSGMLTAINDFVSDSFKADKNKLEQNLDVIKTDDFSLLIKRGPHLMLVAAVSGNVPHTISNRLQVTVEQIHKLYRDEINQFSGDTLPFETTESNLRECLVAELKDDTERKSKRPWMAITLVLLVVIGLFYLAVQKYQIQQMLKQVQDIDQQPGIIVREAGTQGMDEVWLQLLRDPNAIEVSKWLSDRQIDSSLVHYTEKPFLSLEPELVEGRLRNLISQYPQLTLNVESVPWQIQGKVTHTLKQNLIAQLSAVPGLNNVSQLIEGVAVGALQEQLMDSSEMLSAMFKINSSKIDDTQIEFEAGQSQLTPSAQEKLNTLAAQLHNVIDISQKLELNVGLIIMGASDSSGSKQYNQDLSSKRAQAVKTYLVTLGIDPGYLNVIGLGVMEIQGIGSGARKVIFNLVDFDT